VRNQDTLMRFSPATGVPHPYPSHATQWRHHYGSTAWLFNPWSGERRRAEDVGSDTFGHCIKVDGEPVLAAPETGPERCPDCGEGPHVDGVWHKPGCPQL
jgi:hypothetical protein